MLKGEAFSNDECKDEQDLPLALSTIDSPTIYAKSLGTLAMIYAIEELENPLPCTMLCEGGTNNPAGGSDAFLHS